MKRRSPWTPSLDATLRHLWRIDGVPAAEIARRLGVTYDRVTYRADQLRLCVHPLKSRLSDNLRELRVAWEPSDFAFWTVKPASEVSRA